MLNAVDVIRYVPLIYLISPSTGRRISVALHKGLIAADAEDLAHRSQTEPFIDGPVDILNAMRYQALLEYATDWRFMMPAEIEGFCAEIGSVYELSSGDDDGFVLREA